MCVLKVCAARDSLLTNTVRRRLHDISSAERWISRDHDLSKTSGRRPAPANLELVRPDHAVFFLPCSGFNVPISNGRRSDREKYIVYSCSLLVQKTSVLWRCACCCGMCISFVDSEISACDAGHLLESTNRFMHARFAATSNTSADLSKLFCLRVFSGGV